MVWHGIWSRPRPGSTGKKPPPSKPKVPETPTQKSQPVSQHIAPSAPSSAAPSSAAPTFTYQCINWWSLDNVQRVFAREVDIHRRDDDGLTPLMWAAQDQHIDIVNSLLEIEKELDLQDARGRTSLHIACLTDNVELVKLFLQRGASIDATDHTGSTALHIASGGSKLKVVKLLHRHLLSNDVKFDIDLENKEGCTALQLAAINDRSTTVRFLLMEGARWKKENGVVGQNAAHMAAARGFSDVIQVFIDHGLKDQTAMETKSASGLTVLHYAARKGDFKTAHILVQNRANVHAESTTDGLTPLYYAAMGDHFKVSGLLIGLGADMYALSKNKSRLWFHLVEHGTIAIVGCFLGDVVDVNRKDDMWPNRGATALHYACCRKDGEVVKMLLEEGADVSEKDENNRTALHEAARAGNNAAVILLKAASAVMNAQDLQGNTPLHLAVINGHGELTNWLMNNGSSANISNSNGQTPYQVASFSKDATIMIMLKAASQGRS